MFVTTRRVAAATITVVALGAGAARPSPVRGPRWPRPSNTQTPSSARGSA
jgi:hypothetical protein